MSSECIPGVGVHWRNLITKECRDTPPPPGELDWIEESTSAVD